MAVSKKPTRISSKKPGNIMETQKIPQVSLASESTPKPAGAPGPASSLHVVPPTEEQVRRRAYEIYEAQGRPEGRHEEHWRQAEKEVRGRTA
jgi:hypothetical protein